VVIESTNTAPVGMYSSMWLAVMQPVVAVADGGRMAGVWPSMHTLHTGGASSTYTL
jgi:hypothetical protein